MIESYTDSFARVNLPPPRTRILRRQAVARYSRYLLPLLVLISFVLWTIDWNRQVIEHVLLSPNEATNGLRFAVRSSLNALR